MSIIRDIYWFFQWLMGWSRTPDDGSVVRLPTEVGPENPLENSVPLELILAYVRNDAETLYVVKGKEEVVAKHLKATINGNTWAFKEAGLEVTRDREIVELSIHDFTISVVRWIDFDGFDCKRLPAGKWTKVYSRKRGWNSWKYKVKMYFKTNETGWWCVKTKNKQCRTVWNDFEGEYRVRRNRKWDIVRETHRLAGCAG